MPSVAQLLKETVLAARAGQWLEHRQRFAALREALLERLEAGDEELRIRFDTLNAAAPSHDPVGYLAELEALARLVQEHGVAEGDIAERLATLDLRGLQPPEPIVRIFEALERAPGARLRAILPHEPVPLYNLLRERGFSFTGTPRADGSFEVLIESS
jgi:uncharacterized protein (DUF2249 family)